MIVPQDLLTSDLLQEAMRLRWIEAESEIGGYRHITNNLAKLEEMEQAADDVGVGDTVIVGEAGQSYTGTVKSIDRDGIRLAFGDKKPPVERPYQRTEVKQVARPKVEVPQGQSPVNPEDDRGRHEMFRYATGMMNPMAR